MESYSSERIECFENAFNQRILPPTQLPLLQSVGARPRRAEACCLRQHVTFWRENHDNTISQATIADKSCKKSTYRYVGGITLPGQTANIRA